MCQNSSIAAAQNWLISKQSDKYKLLFLSKNLMNHVNVLASLIEWSAVNVNRVCIITKFLMPVNNLRHFEFFARGSGSILWENVFENTNKLFAISIRYSLQQ